MRHTHTQHFFLCVAGFSMFIPSRSMIEASKVGHSASYVRSRLLVAAGGSLRFGCQHPAPRKIPRRGRPFRTTATTKKPPARSTSIRVRKSRLNNFSEYKTRYRKVVWPWTSNMSLVLTPKKRFLLVHLRSYMGLRRRARSKNAWSWLQSPGRMLSGLSDKRK